MALVKQVLCFYFCGILMMSCLCQSTPECQNKDSERLICPSFDAVALNEPLPKWKKLNVNNDGKMPLTHIKRGIFKNYKHIDDLQVKNLAYGIERGAFDGLTNLHELHLDDNYISEIKPNVFENLPIVVLYIYNCAVEKIYPNAFNNLPKLKNVYIYGNRITTIEENVFTSTWFSTVILRKNRIRNVEANAFISMPFLKFLSLEENEITEFDPRTIIGFAPKLEYLYINRNQISKASKDMYKLMPLLKSLLLNLNKIDKIEEYIFSDLPQLYLLDISNNHFKELSPDVFKSSGHPDLKYLFIHNNKLTFLSTEVFKRMPGLISISMGGNPWQCSCWKFIDDYLKSNNISKICNEEYKQGNRPFCAISKNYPHECIYDTEEVQDVVELFDSAITEYGKLPPICNIDGFNTPTLGQ